MLYSAWVCWGAQSAGVEAVNGTGLDFHQFYEPGPAAVVAAGVAMPSGEGATLHGRHNIFKMMVVGFSNGWVSAFYILGVGLLCLHLSHGASSMFQSIGWKNEAYRPFLDKAAWVVALVIFLGYVSIPTAILLGYGREVIK